MAEARGILTNEQFAAIRASHTAGVTGEVRINGRTLLYQADLPTEGFSLASTDQGFAIGPKAFRSEAELRQTILHELYRLEFGDIPGNAAAVGTQGTIETDAAVDFARRAYGYLDDLP